MVRIAGTFTIFLLLLLLPLTVLAQKRVLVIESYHAEFAWDASYKRAMKESLEPSYQFDYFEMNTKRLPRDQHRKMADLAWDKYLAVKPDLVVLGDDAALEFLAQRFAGTRTPVVYLGINNNPRYYIPNTAQNFTGVLERPLLKRSIAFLQDLLPTARSILVLFDDDVTSQVIRREIFAGKDSVDVLGVTVEIRLLDNLKSWKDNVFSSKGRYDACVIGLYQAVKDADGKPVDADELITWVSRNSPIPTFAFWDFAVGTDKTAGGLILSGKDMGVQASSLVKRILDDSASPKSVMPLYNNNGVFLFSRAQLAKWKLTLPKSILSSATLID